MPGVYLTADLAIRSLTFAPESSDIRATILSGHTFSASDVYLDDVTADEIDSGYRTAVDISVSDASGTRTWTCPDIDFGQLPTGTAETIVFYEYHVSDASARLLCALDVATGDTVLDGRPWTAKIPTAGLFHCSVAADSFTRADSAVAPGGAFTTVTGTVGISSNQAYAPSGGLVNVATQDAGEADGSVSLRLATIHTGEYPSIVMRATTSGNQWELNIQPEGGLLTLYGIIGGSYFTQWTEGGITWASGDVITLDARGTVYRAWRNGVPVHSAYTDTGPFNNTATKVGFRVDGTTGGPFTRVDDFLWLGMFSVEDLEGELSDVTVIWSNAYPADGATGVGPGGRVRVTATPIDDATNPISAGTEVVTVDSLPLDADWIATTSGPAGAVTIEGVFPFVLGRAYTVEFEVETADTTVNSYVVEFTTRGAMGGGVGLCEVISLRSSASPVPVDTIARRPSPSPVLVNAIVRRSGVTTGAGALLHFIARKQQGGVLASRGAMLDYYAAEFWRQSVGAVGALIGSAEVDFFAAGALVEGTARERFTLGAILAVTGHDSGLTVGALLSQWTRDEVLAIGALIGSAETDPFTLGAIIERNRVALQIDLDVRSLALQDLAAEEP